MNKYLIARKKGEMANEVFHLKSDTSANAINRKNTIPWFIRKVKKIKTKEDVIKYHIKKIDKILKSKYFIIEETTKISIKELIDISQKVSNNELDEYTEGDVNAMARIVYKKVASPIWFSLFAMKLNLLEWIIIIGVIIGCSYFM